MRRNDIPVQSLGQRNPRVADVLTIEKPHLTRPPAGDKDACRAREDDRQKRRDAQVGFLSGLSNGRVLDRLARLDLASWKVPTVRHPRIRRTTKEEQHATRAVLDDHGRVSH